MRYRILGGTGFEVSEIGFGAWGIGGKQWLGGSDADAAAALRAAIGLGINFIDTALAYGDGHSEKLVGEAVRNAGRKIYVATKVPPKNRLWPARTGIAIEKVLPYDYVIDCTETSLRNLGVDIIDLQQLHVWNPEWIDRDDWKRAFEDLKRSGKVRAVGISVSEHQPDSALDAIKTGLVDTVQVIYNIFDQAAEKNLFPLCEARNIGVLARVPFDEGSLAGRVTRDTQFARGDFRDWYFRGDRKLQVEERVEALMRDLDLETPEALPEIALRFCLTQTAVSTVIPGMRTSSTVERNAGVSGKGPLPAGTLEVLRRHVWARNFYE
jgi:aryl-alcohol dehydrogenase-like predicted oxidoreductase